nr:hypothetical protein [Tanacetum cinerariifolium]
MDSKLSRGEMVDAELVTGIGVGKCGKCERNGKEWYQPQVVTHSLVVHQQLYQAHALKISFQTPAIQPPSQPSFPKLDSGLVVPSFNISDDPIASLNKAMAFVITTFTSHFPKINNQLRTSSNSRNQVTIQDERVTVQALQGRQTQRYADTRVGNNLTNQGANRNEAAGAYLDPKQLAFLADNEDTFTPLRQFLWPIFPPITQVLSRRSSQEESYGSNDMTHNHYLEEDRKKTQERNRNSKSSVMHTTSLPNTTNGSKPKPRCNNLTSRSLPILKSSCEMLNGVPLKAHSRTSSSFSNNKCFVCSTCQKCVFNVNHDDCITKFLKGVNSCSKVQSPKSRNNIKPAKRIPNVNKPKRWVSQGYMLSPNKSSAVHEKPNTPRSCLRWKPTGKIFKIARLRWIPTEKMFTDSITKVDSEPPNGLVQNIPSLTPAVQPTKNDWDSFFHPMFDKHFKRSPNVDHPVLAASTSSPSSTTIDQDAPSTSTLQTISKQQSSVIPQGVEDDFYDIEVAYMDNDPSFELKDIKATFNQMETEAAKCFVDKKYFEIEKKELYLDNDGLLEHIICQDVMDVVMHTDVHNVLSANNNCLDNDNLALE